MEPSSPMVRCVPRDASPLVGQGYIKRRASGRMGPVYRMYLPLHGTRSGNAGAPASSWRDICVASQGEEKPAAFTKMSASMEKPDESWSTATALHASCVTVETDQPPPGVWDTPVTRVCVTTWPLICAINAFPRSCTETIPLLGDSRTACAEMCGSDASAFSRGTKESLASGDSSASVVCFRPTRYSSWLSFLPEPSEQGVESIPRDDPFTALLMRHAVSAAIVVQHPVAPDTQARL